MSTKDTFVSHINSGYTTKGDSILLGAAMLNGETIAEAQVKIPLKTLNRHGLIAGATGTGKTKTIQVLSEQLSSFGIPVLNWDIKPATPAIGWFQIYFLLLQFLNSNCKLTFLKVNPFYLRNILVKIPIAPLIKVALVSTFKTPFPIAANTGEGFSSVFFTSSAVVSSVS